MLKKEFKEEARGVLRKEFSKAKDVQINLNSAAAIENLIDGILDALSGKFYMIPYSTQDSFE